MREMNRVKWGIAGFIALSLMFGPDKVLGVTGLGTIAFLILLFLYMEVYMPVANFVNKMRNPQERSTLYSDFIRGGWIIVFSFGP